MAIDPEAQALPDEPPSAEDESAVRARLEPVTAPGEQSDTSGGDGIQDGEGEEESSPEDELFERLENRLEALGILTDSFQLRGPAEDAMLRTLASRDLPLRDREGFLEAHQDLARALEATMVSGKEAVTLPRRFGPLRALMSPLVQILAGWLIETQTKSVFKNVRLLYELREANAPFGSLDHRDLRRCRAQMQTISDDLGASKLGLPVFLLSGAFISGLLSVARTVVRPFLGNTWLTILLIVAVVLVLVVITTTVLQAASIAKMRLRLALVAPLYALYRAIGNAGEVPRDRCFLVAIGALVLFALAVVTLPSLLLLVDPGVSTSN